jgi:hypothetical protein
MPDAPKASVAGAIRSSNRSTVNLTVESVDFFEGRRFRALKCLNHRANQIVFLMTILSRW